MEKDNKKTYWPHMILGFLSIGIMLGFWTVKSAINMPVSESNEYQLKYQEADMHTNDILEAKARFEEKYDIKFLNFKKSNFKPNKFLKRKHGDILALEKVNIFQYSIKDKSGILLKDANVTLLVTRPHTRVDDVTMTLKSDSNGIYTSKKIILSNEGRYIIRLKARKGNMIDLIEQEAYLRL